MKQSYVLFKVLLFPILFLNLSVYYAAGQSYFQQKTSKEIYGTGYVAYKTKDTSRLYKPNVSKENTLYFRPVELDVWYPAKISSGTVPMSFRYFVSLFEKRANSFQDSTTYNGLTGELMQHFTIANDKNGQTSLLTKSYLNAEEIKGSFPLIIYMSAFNGMSYENVPLFENLAGQGYVVVSISSVGRYPGNMTTKYPDMLEQVKDAEFAINYLHGKNADISKIGVIGYSYGGLSATVLAMRNKSIKAVLSLDGSETHYYARDKQEDKDFDDLRHSQYLNPYLLKCPYAYFESDHKLDDGSVDSVYRLKTPAEIKNDYLRIIGAEHEDFSCISDLGATDYAPYELVNSLSLAYFEQYLSDDKSTFDKEAVGLLATQKGSAIFPKTALNAADTIGRIILKGKIVAIKDNMAIPYVSIGIPAGDCGTVSDNGGNFSLTLPGKMLRDTIRISSLGYHPQIFIVKQLVSTLSRRPIIRLNEQISSLNQVNITAKMPHIKTIGNTSKSKFFNVGFPLRDLGSEVGIKVSLGRKMVRLRSFNFNISQIRLDSGTFRLNIYALKNGYPAENLLTQNILIGIAGKPGTYQINLLPYLIYLKGDIFVSLEWIAGKTAVKNGVVFFSAGLLASSYHRKTTEATWVSFKGLGAGFNLKVENVE